MEGYVRMSKDRPILFSAPMIRALLEGRKTQTRRLAWRPYEPPGDGTVHIDAVCVDPGEYARPSIWQKVEPGDRIWVRETWQTGMGPDGPQITYRATPDYFDIDAWDGDDYGAGPSFNYDKCPGATWHTWLSDLLAGEKDAGGWRSPIHMPRWASRLTLEVTATKIEPLLDISEDDAIAEGFKAGRLNDGFGPRDFGNGWTIESPGTLASAVGVFQIAWSQLHPDWDGFSSREVVALTFTVHKCNIDKMARAA